METATPADKVSTVLVKLKQLRNFSGSPSAFWEIYCQCLAEIASAKAVMIALAVPGAQKSWKPLGFFAINGPFSEEVKTLRTHLAELASPILTEQPLVKSNAMYSLLGFALQSGQPNNSLVALLYTASLNEAEVQEKLQALASVNDYSSEYQFKQSANEAFKKIGHFSSILELLVLLNEKKRFLEAAMTFCNELATRFQCDRVSLGWAENGYVKVKAISHSDEFDKKMEAVQKLELAMEECMEQDQEIVYPGSGHDQTIKRDTQAFAKDLGINHVLIIPMRHAENNVGVVLLERRDTEFSDSHLQIIQLTLDQVTPKLAELKNSDRWVGAKASSSLKEKLGSLIGYQHTWAKAIAILIAVVLAFTCFVPITYRLESKSILRTDDMSFLAASFAGHIEQVNVKVGDAVSRGQVLMTLDKKDLLQEETRLIAEKNRYQTESEKARAASELADMRIADAMYEQSDAQLQIIQHRLAQVNITAPWNGIIVEGDQVERVGSPVQQGEVLFKIAKVINMYVELEVPESEFHHLKLQQTGQVALASRPDQKYDFKVERIEPAAVTRESGNVFIVQANLVDSFPKHWRPGMTGISKLNAKKHTLLWILTHRTVDFLRMKLWW